MTAKPCEVIMITNTLHRGGQNISGGRLKLCFLKKFQRIVHLSLLGAITCTAMNTLFNSLIWTLSWGEGTRLPAKCYHGSGN